MRKSRKFFTTSHEQYSHLKTTWQAKGINFHTYTDRNKKQRTYVIRGLHNEVELDQIKQDIEERGYQVQKVNAMKNTRQTKHMITFMGNIQLQLLNQ